MSFLVSLPPDTYRADALDRFTAIPDFTPGNAQAMMWLSQLAYEADEQNNVDEILKKFKLEKRRFGTRFPSKGFLQQKARFIVAGGRGATFVTFAGTDPLKLGDLKTDFTLAPRLNVVHQGFSDAVEAVQSDIIAAINSRGADEQPVFFTGHSMGGALAMIAARNALKAGVRATAVYTFGGPRVGGQDFFDEYTDDLGDRTFRLVRGDDIVAAVPPSLLGNFRHVGRLLHCPHESTFEGRKLATNDGDDPSPVQAVLGALFDIKLGLPSVKSLLNTDPRFFDESDEIPIVLRDHVPASYFHALDVTL